MVQGSGQVATPAILIIAEAILNLGLSIWLGEKLGIDGVALGTLIAAAIATVVAVPLVCRHLEIGTGRFMWEMLRAHLPAIAVACGVAWLITPDLDLDGLVPVALAMIAVSGSYLAVFAVTGLTADERRGCSTDPLGLNRPHRRRHRPPRKLAAHAPRGVHGSGTTGAAPT